MLVLCEKKKRKGKKNTLFYLREKSIPPFFIFHLLLRTRTGAQIEFYQRTTTFWDAGLDAPYSINMAL